jgi:hypothetical protein
VKRVTIKLFYFSTPIFHTAPAILGIEKMRDVVTIHSRVELPIKSWAAVVGNGVGFSWVSWGGPFNGTFRSVVAIYKFNSNMLAIISLKVY